MTGACVTAKASDIVLIRSNLLGVVSDVMNHSEVIKKQLELSEVFLLVLTSSLSVGVIFLRRLGI